MAFARQKLQEWDEFAQRALETIQSLNWDSNSSVLPTDTGCRFQMHAGSFQDRYVQCQLCADLERMTPLYGNIDKTIFLDSQPVQISRFPGESIAPEVVPSPPSSWTGVTYVSADPLTVLAINNWFLSKMWPEKVSKLFFAGYCGDSGVTVREVLAPLSQLDWRDFRLALRQIARMLQRGAEFGLKLGTSSWGLRNGKVVLIPGEDLRINISSKVRMTPDSFELDLPRVRDISLFEPDGTEEDWFLLRKDPPPDGIPKHQVALNWYQTLLQLQKLPNFQMAVKQDPELAGWWRKWFRQGGFVRSLLDRPLRQNPLSIVSNQ